MKPISVQVDEIMTGLNPSADARLAADLGVRIAPDAEDEVPPVILGNKGYETDAAGRDISRKVEALRKESLMTAVSISKGMSKAEFNAMTLGMTLANSFTLGHSSHNEIAIFRDAVRAAYEARLLELVEEAKDAGVVS